MKTIEYRALMGDKEAQMECTRQGIVLPCPCCKGSARIRYTGNNSGPNGYISNVYIKSKPGLVMCGKCGLKTSAYTKVYRALARWNTRTAPQIGRCKECAMLKPWGECSDSGEIVDSNFYCGNFNLKEGVKSEEAR